MAIETRNLLNPRGEPLFVQALELAAGIFGDGAPEIEGRLADKRDVLLTAATNDDRLIGFKLGYAESTAGFYSWLGGVQEEHRGKGVARALLESQHAWCKQRGYEVIRTKTMNKWRAMLILNIKQGFDVIGTYADHHGETKILLEKRL